MLKVSVHPFYSHLPLEQQDPVLVSQEAFLKFLRSEFHRNDYAKRALVEAGTAHAKREYVTVTAEFEERFAAKAVIYAYLKIAKELRRRGKAGPRQSHLKVYKGKPYPRPAKQSQTRFRTVETTINGRRERIQQYPLDITWQEARAFQHNELYNLPDVDVHEEYAETSRTAHFEASSRTTGWATLYLDGQAVERIRCWDVG